MRQLLYLSQRKLRDEFLQEPRLRDRLQGSVAVPIPLGPTLNASLSAPTGNTDLDVRHFKSTIRHLNRVSVGDYFVPDVRPLDWVRFDLPMVYGTTYEDSRIPPLDDIALFANLRSFAEVMTPSHVDLLLCGSVQHLTRTVAGEGRMGSGTDWLYELIIYMKDKEVAGGFMTRADLERHGISSEATHPELAMAVDFAHGVLQREHPRRQQGRLSGIAQVLADVRSEFIPTRIVLATPLYVQVEPGRRRLWKRAR